MKKISILIIVILAALPFLYGINLAEGRMENYFYRQIYQPFQNKSLLKIQKKPKLSLDVRSAISLKINRFGRKKILYRKNINQPLPIASLSKLVTAMVGLDFFKNKLSEGVVVSKKAASQEDVPPARQVNLKGGERVTIRDLLERMLIYSVNDAASALAEATESQSRKSFVSQMNKKVKEAGLGKTHFANPTGLDPEGLSWNRKTMEDFNYSDAGDLAKLSQYIFKNYPLIFQYSLKRGRYRRSDGISSIELPKGENLLGVKTGYTDEAGGCLILIFGNEKRHIINVILGAPSASSRIKEMQKLINWLAQPTAKAS